MFIKRGRINKFLEDRFDVHFINEEQKRAWIEENMKRDLLKECLIAVAIFGVLCTGILMF